MYRLSAKPISFRPSPKAEDKIKNERKLHPKWKPSKIVNYLIERDESESKAEESEDGRIPPTPTQKQTVWIFCPKLEKIVSHRYCVHDCDGNLQVNCRTYGVFCENFDFEEGIPIAPKTATKKEE